MSAFPAPAPFDDEEAAEKERDLCDYTVKVTMEEALEGRAKRKIRVYADGIFDLFHQGHAKMILQAKNAFPKCEVRLLVGCCSDEDTHARKGPTVMTEFERCETLRHFMGVDEVIRKPAWNLDEAFLEKHKIDFVAHDAVPYTAGGEGGQDVFKLVKERGMFLATERTEGVSTTDVVSRVLRNYRQLVTQYLDMGYSPEDLNLQVNGNSGKTD